MTKHDIAIRRFRASDLDKIDLLADEWCEIKTSEGFLEFIASDQPGAFCGTAWEADTPIAIGGYWQAAPGVWQCFIAPSQYLVQHPTLLVRLTLAWVRRIEKLDGHRIQTYSLPMPRIRKWMGALGFACEGVLRRYTKTGQDYEIWSRVKVDGVWRGVTS